MRIYESTHMTSLKLEKNEESANGTFLIDELGLKEFYDEIEIQLNKKIGKKTFLSLDVDQDWRLKEFDLKPM